MTTTTPAEQYDAVVIGAGFSGMYMLYKLREMGLSALVVEAGDDVGGTWYWNRYPGACCDVESHYYSYSFSPELEQEWEWSRRYPAQPELLSYLRHVADRFDLRRDIRFSTWVKSAHFDEGSNRWTTLTDDGRALASRFLITGVGCLSTTNLPDFEGLSDFEGRWYHTGQWPHEEVDLEGATVGVIGTGSTGIQAIPEFAKVANRLLVFQRTPNYTVPAQDGPLDPDEVARIKADYRTIREISRNSDQGFPVERGELSALEVEPDERTAVFNAAWEAGGCHLRYTYKDLQTDLPANETVSDFIRGRIREIVKDPVTAELLAPKDHPYGTKRPPLDTDYYETYNRENVRLVDVRGNEIRRITANGVQLADGSEYPLDVLVFATGYDAMTGSLLRIGLTGRNGLTLQEKWGDGIPRNYLGLQVAGFPNLFTITGPGSPSVLANMVVSIEHHVEWIADCIRSMEERGHEVVETDEVAEKSWVETTTEIAAGTLFEHGNSWYLGANIPGKKRFFLPYAGGLGRYRATCDDVVANDYAGFTFS